MSARIKGADPMLAVPDVEAAVAFYARCFGFERHSLYGEPPFYGIVERDGVWINFIKSDSAAGDEGDRGGAYVSVEDVDALYEEVRITDAVVWEPPEDKDYGMRDFIAIDLNGYRLCFGQRIENR